MWVSPLVTDGTFMHLVQEQIPAIGRLPAVRAAMKKYTAGYLTEKRWAEVLAPGTMPMMDLASTDPLASGDQGGEIIRIDTDYFQGFKDGNPNDLTIVPLTILHELAHWGYRRGQREGYPSDEFGRAHNNHNGWMSPLDAELKSVIEANRALLAPKLMGPVRRMTNRYMRPVSFA